MEGNPRPARKSTEFIQISICSIGKESVLLRHGISLNVALEEVIFKLCFCNKFRKYAWTYM